MKGPLVRGSCAVRDAFVEPHFTVSVVARHLGVSDRTVRRLLAERKLGYVKRGHWVRVPLSSLNRYIAEGECPARDGLSLAKQRDCA
jgi:excisionase family DNA binding protein